MNAFVAIFIYICFMKAFTTILLSLFFINVFAQNIAAFQQNSIIVDLSSKNNIQYKLASLDTRYFTSAIVHYKNIAKLKYKTCNGPNCSDWIFIEKDLHVSEENSDNYSSLLFLNNEHNEIVFDYDNKSINSSLKVTLNYYKVNDKNKTTLVSQRNCTCESLAYKNRAQWSCPDTEESSLFVPDYTKHTHIVVHHQAGFANPPYDQTVQAIYDYHVNSNGWSDIGYNWLIAPDGTIYKGRSWLNGDQNVRGAHTCACNSSKLGICLLGNLTSNLPTPAQYESLKKFITWKACELEIKPDVTDSIVSSKSGTCITEYMHHVTGHRDNCGAGYTECPGEKFYSIFEKMKTEVIDQYYACVDTLNTSIVESSIKKQFIISENPIKTTMKIDVLSDGMLYVCDINGRMQNKLALSKGEHIVEMGDFGKGIYFVKYVDLMGGIGVEKVVKL